MDTHETATLPMAPDASQPDVLPAREEQEPVTTGRGRLKVFFGAAAGVGKTYAMLEAAQERRAQGIEVIVGLVELHGRKETAALLSGLERLSPRHFDYGGTTLREFDLDGALRRRPGLILIDELAHTNAPGSRHPKRWQDIEEVLEAGIDVYTTLNVQDLESLNDDVEEIAGIRVRETVPDTVFEEADEIELVDLPPEELLVRLQEGKVHLPALAKHAVEQFFRKGNLIALRELALRQTANRVDAQMLDYRENHAIRKVWQVAECILVCIGPTPLAERLVRAGKRFAMSLRCDWIVAYVETPELQRLSAQERDAVLRILRLAEQLGAEAVTLTAPTLSVGILDFARERNITKIVMGKPTRRGWKRWLLGSVVDTLIGEAHNINLYLLGSPHPSQAGTEAKLSLLREAPPPGLSEPLEKRRQNQYRRYIPAVLVTVLCSLVAEFMFGRFDHANLIMVYLIGVIFVATRFGLGPSILNSVLGVAAFDLLFVTPYYSLSVSDTQYFLTLAGMLAVAMVISHLIADVRYQATVARHRERRATVLYAASRELSAARSESEIVHTAVQHIHAEFGSRNVILFPDGDGRIAYPSGRCLEPSLCSCDLDVAQWVFEHNEKAGQGTNTLADAQAVYFPLAADGKTIGVLAMLPANLRRVFLPEQLKLLESFLGQTTHALERVRMAEQTRAASVQMEAERLRSSLLDSISHDLRVPLASIIGTANTLLASDAPLESADRLQLGRAICEEAQRMSGLVTNILDMARLDAGAVELDRRWHSLAEVVETVLERSKRKLGGHEVTVKVAPDMPSVYMDAALIERVLEHLLENAARNTPPETPITLSAERSPFTVTISVADRGPGIPAGQEERIFEKFFRVQREDAQGGAGLGLAICRAIVEAHGGWIGAKNRGTGGSVFSFVLPMEAMPAAGEGTQDESPDAS